jgi:hypothetical protein
VSWRTAAACPARRTGPVGQAARTSPTAARRRLCGWPSTTRRAPIRAALLVWEPEGNRRCDPRSPRALRRRTGRRRRLVRLRAAAPGCWSGRRRNRPICPDAQASAPGPTGSPLFHQAVIGFLRSPRQVAPGDPKPRAYSASCSGVIFTIGAPPPTLGGDATLQAKRQLHPTKYRPPRGRVYQASVVIPLSLRDPRDARRARVRPFTMDLLKAACYARRSGFVPTRALSGTFSRPGDGASGTRRGTLMEYPQGHRGACTRTVPKPVACCLNCRFVESFTRQRSCRPPQAA